MSEQHTRDWQKTRIHAACGAVIGGGPVFLGGGNWETALVCAILVGLLAGMYLDQFWDHFPAWWR